MDNYDITSLFSVQSDTVESAEPTQKEPELDLGLDTSLIQEPSTQELPKSADMLEFIKEDDTEPTPTEQFQAFQTGAAATVAGGIEMAKDLGQLATEYNPLTIFTGEDFSKKIFGEDFTKDPLNQEVITKLNDDIATYKDKFGQELDMTDLGRLMPSLSTLPVAYTSKIMGSAIEGALAYSETRGGGSSKMQSLISGTIAAGMTGVFMHTLNYMTTPASKLAYNAILERFQYTPKEADEIYQRWLQVMEPSKDGMFSKANEYAERTKAMLDDASRNRFKLGEEFIERGTSLSTKAAMGVEREILDRSNELKKIVSTKYDTFEEAAKDIQTINYQIRADYEYVKQSISPKVIKNTLDDVKLPNQDIFDTLPDVVKSDMLQLKTLAGKPELSVGDLIDASKIVNRVLTRPSVRGTEKSYNLGKIKGQIHKELSKNLTPQEFKAWKQINTDYRHMKQVQNSKIGSALERLIGVNAKADSDTYTSFIKTLYSTDEHPETFQALAHIVGTSKAAKLENRIISQVLMDSKNPYAWSEIYSRVGKKGFMTKSGQAAVELLEKMKTSMQGDASYRAMVEGASGSYGEGAKTSIWDAAAAIGVRRLVNMLVGAIPKVTPFLGEAGHIARTERFISSILERPSNVRKISDYIDTMPIQQREAMARDLVKQLEYKPHQGTTISSGAATRKTGPMYATERGTIATNPSQAAISEKSYDLLRKHLEGMENFSADKISKTAEKYLQDSRISQVIKSAEKRYKLEKFNTDVREASEIIRKEADVLIKRIQSDLGIKLPKDEANKIIKLKMGEYLSKE